MQKLRKSCLLIIFLLLSAINITEIFAGNFSITPVGKIPSSILINNTINVYFKVTNLTSSTRKGYYLSPLPANVTQLFSSALYSTPICTNPLTLGPNASCLLMFKITGPASFNFSLCNGGSCTRSSLSVNLQKEVMLDSSFPYGSAPEGNVCVSSDYYATPETMLGSWAMLQAVDMDIASGQLPSAFKDNIVYAVGTAAVGNYYGYNNCGGGCNQLNGYCFAIKFNTKSTYSYMIFESVNIGANTNSFDIYMAGGGCGAFCNSCGQFWGTNTIPWSDHILNSSCAAYFANANNINSAYSVTYNGQAHPAKTTLLDACTFSSSSVSGFNTQNFDNIVFVPVTCPQALTQVTGLALPSSVQTIGTNNIPLIPISSLTESSFTGPNAITSATTTQMQDCKTPSSGYCGNVASSIPNYQASISASTTAPLIENGYCEKNPGIAGFCSWNSCGDSGSTYCNSDRYACQHDCGGEWCTCHSNS